MQKRVSALAIWLAIAIIVTPARADEAPAPSQSALAREEVSVQAYGAAHPDCSEWSDSCIVCTKAGCSTPGIACAPAPTVCRR